MKKILHIYILTLTLFIFNDLKALDYYLRAAGNINSASSWSPNSNGVGGTSPANFSGTHTWNLRNRTSANLGGLWNLPTTATVFIGDGLSAFTLSVTTGFGEIRNAPININALSTLEIINTGSAKNYNFSTLDVTSTVIYKTSTQKVTPAIYGNLIISTTNTLSTSVSGTDVFGNLTINASQRLVMDGNQLNINGNILGTGVIRPDASATLYFLTGTGANAGTLLFESGFNSIGTFYVSYLSPNSFITLGSDVQVASAFFQELGSIALNGRTLTVDATADASFALDNVSGGFIGDANASIILNGSIGLSSGLPDLYMDATANTLKVLSINSVSSLNIANTLNITDSLDVTDATVTTSGNLTLKSTDALKARISEIKGAGSVTGDINVETFIKGGFAAWTGIAPSGVDGLSVTNWDGGSGSSTAFAMTCNGCINDEYSAGGSYFVSIQSDPLGNGVYTDLIASDPLTPGIGYWAFIGSDLTSAVDITQTTTGPIVTSGVTTPATSFVSNPYPSPISVDRMQATNPTMGAVYVWDGDAGAYVTYNAGVGALPNGAISMGQSFYIDGSGVSFQESHKVARNTSANYLMKTASNNVGTVFQLQVNGTNSDIDKMYVRLHQDATTNYDANLDAYKKFATPGYVGYPSPYTAYTTISSKLNNTDYSINSLPLLSTTNLVLPVLVKVMATGSYTISPIDIANLPPNVCVTLHDKLLNTNHDLRTGSYVCTINDSTSVPRFELTICTENIVTGINNLVSNENNTLISQDINGVFVKTNFEKNTKATISVYNVMGQKVMTDKEIEGTELTVYLNELNIHDQVVIIRVTSATKNTTKKVFVN